MTKFNMHLEAFSERYGLVVSKRWVLAIKGLHPDRIRPHAKPL